MFPDKQARHHLRFDMARLPYSSKPTRYLALNVVKVLSHSSATVGHWEELGNAQFKSLQLSKKLRELVILLSTAKFQSSYEWTHHVGVSARHGVSDAQRAVLATAGRTKSFFSSADHRERAKEFSAQEALLLQFVEAVIEGPEIDDDLWEKVKGTFTEREIVEIISLQASKSNYCQNLTMLIKSRATIIPFLGLQQSSRWNLMSLQSPSYDLVYRKSVVWSALSIRFNSLFINVGNPIPGATRIQSAQAHQQYSLTIKPAKIVTCGGLSPNNSDGIVAQK